MEKSSSKLGIRKCRVASRTQRLTHFCSIEYYVFTVRKYTYWPRWKIVMHLIEHDSSSRICIIVCKKSCTTSFPVWENMSLKKRVHIQVKTDVCCLSKTKGVKERIIWGMTSWEPPKDVTVGSEETKEVSHSLIALWSSFRWPYFGSLIMPENEKCLYYS